MPNRLIKDSVRESNEIDSLNWFQEVVFYRLIVTVDDFGRYYANPQIVKSALFPTKENLAKKDVANALDKLEEVGLIKRYEYDGKQYLEFSKWSEHQQRRAIKSKFPDINGNHLISNDIKKDQKKSGDNKRSQKKSEDIIGLQMSPYSYSNTNTETIINGADPADPDGLISIQKEHDALFDEARKIGLPLTDYNMKQIVDLYSEYGLEPVNHGISEAARLNKISIAYIKTCAQNFGKEKPSEEERLDDSILASCW